MKAMRSSLCKIAVLLLALIPVARGADNIPLIIADIEEQTIFLSPR